MLAFLLEKSECENRVPGTNEIPQRGELESPRVIGGPWARSFDTSSEITKKKKKLKPQKLKLSQSWSLQSTHTQVQLEVRRKESELQERTRFRDSRMLGTCDRRSGSGSHYSGAPDSPRHRTEQGL